MDKAEIQTLIKEAILKESLGSLDHLQDGISLRTMTGRPWSNLIGSVESLMDEMKDFRSLYNPRLHGPLPNTNEGVLKLQQVIQLLTELKPIVMEMDDIERKDR